MDSINQLKQYIFHLNSRLKYLENQQKNWEQSRSYAYTKILRRIFKFLKSFKISAFTEIDILKDTYINESFFDMENFLELIVKNQQGKTKILVFFSHELSFTGAPIVLLDLAKSINLTNKYNCFFISLDSGPLANSIAKDFPLLVLRKGKNEWVNDFSTVIKKLSKEFNSTQIRFILNTVTLGGFGEILDAQSIKYLTWIHELPTSWNLIGLDNVERQLKFSSQIVADSHEILKAIDIYFGSKILSKSSYISNGLNFEINNAPENIFSFLGLKDETFLITIMGTKQIRKGYDLLPLLIEALVQRFKPKNPDVFKVIWAGKTVYPELDGFIIQDLTRLNLNDYFLPLEDTELYPDILNASNVFLTLSREDSSSQVLQTARELGVFTFVLGSFNSTTKISEYFSELADKIYESYLSSNKRLSQINYPFYHNSWNEIALEFIDVIENSNHILPEKESYNLAHNFDSELTVIIPTYKQRKFLRLRLDSIADQTILPSKIVIINDDIDISVSDIVREFSNNHPLLSLELVENTVRNGIATKSWQQGLQLCATKYVWVAEGDDSADCQFIEKMMQNIRENSSSIAMCRSQIIDEYGKTMNLDHKNLFINSNWQLPFNHKFGYFKRLNLFTSNSIENVGSCIFETQVLLDACLKSTHSKSLVCDWEVYLHIVDDVIISYIPEKLNLFRSHINTQRTLISDEEMSIQIQYILSSILVDHGKLDSFEKLQIVTALVRGLKFDIFHDVLSETIISVRNDSKLMNLTKILFLRQSNRNPLFLHHIKMDWFNLFKNRLTFLDLVDSSLYSEKLFDQIISLFSPNIVFCSDENMVEKLLSLSTDIKICYIPIDSNDTNFSESDNILFISAEDMLSNYSLNLNNNVYFLPKTRNNKKLFMLSEYYDFLDFLTRKN
jgi:hypothetical protein